MRNHDDEITRERGQAMLTVMVAFTALLAAGALAIDAGMVFVARSQAQNASDAAALAAARNMIDKTTPAVTLGAANTAALGVASSNSTIANASVTIDTGDIVYGNWDPDTEVFDTSVDLANPNLVTGVQVTSYLTDTGPNTPVPAFLARILGIDEFDVSATATAYLGYAGPLRPRHGRPPHRHRLLQAQRARLQEQLLQLAADQRVPPGGEPPVPR